MAAEEVDEGNLRLLAEFGGSAPLRPDDPCIPSFWWPPGLAISRRPRAYELDWVRAILIHVMVIVNVFVIMARVLNRDCTTTFSVESGCSRAVKEIPVTAAPSSGFWNTTHLEPDIFCRLTCLEVAKIEGTIRVLVQICLPLFFYLSGRAASSSRRGPLLQVYHRATTYLLPLVTAVAVLVPLSNYLQREYYPCAEPKLSFGDFYVDFWKHKFMECAGFEWALPLLYLFAISVFNIVFFSWMNLRYDNPAVTSWDASTDLVHLMTLFVQCAVFILTFGPLVSLPRAAAALVPYVGYVACVLSWHWWRSKFPWFLFIISPAISLALAAVEGAELKTMTGITQIVYLNYFYLEGFVDHLFGSEYQLQKGTPGHEIFRPMGVGVLIVFLAVCVPTSDLLDAGYMWSYPLYAPREPMGDPLRGPAVTFVLGSWLWIIVGSRLLLPILSMPVMNKKWYRHFTRSGIVAFLFHVPLIALLVRLLVYPTTFFYWFHWFGYFVIIQLTIAGLFIIYAILYNIPVLGLPFGFFYWRSDCFCGQLFPEQLQQARPGSWQDSQYPSSPAEPAEEQPTTPTDYCGICGAVRDGLRLLLFDSSCAVELFSLHVTGRNYEGVLHRVRDTESELARRGAGFIRCKAYNNYDTDRLAQLAY